MGRQPGAQGSSGRSGPGRENVAGATHGDGLTACRSAHTANVPPLTEQSVAESLADLQSLFADAEPVTQYRIALALYKPGEVLGHNEVWLHPSVKAEGHAAGQP